MAQARGLIEDVQVRAFVVEMAREHRFSQRELQTLFRQVDLQQAILERMAKPAEAKPWHIYRNLFITDARIAAGLAFWREHAAKLAQAQQRYGVAPEIIVGILGVETGYGQNTGHFRVIDALSTLAFAYPKRAAFFRQELKEYLLLCREEKLDPLQPKGSYAGAMGLPQFMPGSFRHYAADFDGDGRRDIWRNPGDAIASVANYFAAHGWRSGAAVVYSATVQGEDANGVLDGDLKPHHRFSQLQAQGVRVTDQLAPDVLVKLLRLEESAGYSWWVGLPNFYVITRYNHSPLYAMAVYQLGQAIKLRQQKEST